MLQVKLPLTRREACFHIFLLGHHEVPELPVAGEAGPSPPGGGEGIFCDIPDPDLHLPRGEAADLSLQPLSEARELDTASCEDTVAK